MAKTDDPTPAQAPAAEATTAKEPVGLTWKGDADHFIDGQPMRDLTVDELLAREPATVIHMTSGADPLYAFTKAGTDAWEARHA